MPESCAYIIDSLIDVRHARGMSQKDVALAAGLPQSVIARLESKKAMPQLDTLVKVATALSCDIAVVPIVE